MKKVIIAAALLLTPFVSFAQDLSTFEDLLLSIGRLVDLATPIVVGIALLAFFWGLAVYIFNSGNEERKSEGKNIMIWGIIALFVMVSVWGIVDFIGDALDIGQGGTIPVPQVNVR